MTGIVCAASAGILWGILPVYWNALSSIKPVHILAARIIFSCIFVTIVLLAKKNTDGFRLARQKPVLLLFSGMLICFNWGIYIFAVQTGKTVQASLGYYINPLFSIMLGLIVLKEKLSALQWASAGLAAAGVGILAVFAGVLPWISFALAFSFGMYGLLKKRIPAGALDGLCAETLFSLPVAAVLLMLPLGKGAAYIFSAPPPVIAGVIFAGPVTAVPLYLFSKGAKLLPLSLLGFIQFLSPTLNLVIGVFIFGEPFPARNLIPFSMVWAASLLYALSYARKTVAKSKKIRYK